MLRSNVTGCCDCGDPEGWDMKGACSTHKGIDSSKEQALSALPASVLERAPHVFRSLAKILKTCLLGMIENEESFLTRQVFESMIKEFIINTDYLLASWKQCIFFLSEAFIDVIYGSHPILDASCHECCYRYYPDEAFQCSFERQEALAEAGTRYCTCTVLDLLFQADLIYSSKNLSKRVFE